MRRVLWFGLFALLVAGCEDAGQALGEGADGGQPDAVVRDAGSQDAALPDAEGIDAGPAGQCGQAARFEMGVEGFDTSGYEGPLVMTATGVLRLAPPNGGGAVTFFGSAPDVLFEPGSFWGRLELYQPFWTEARLTLWRVGSDGAPSDLAMYAWSGDSFGAGEAPGVRYRYTSANCIAQADECGQAEGLGLLAEVKGESVPVPYGGTVEGPGYTVFSARSHQFVQGPICPDTPFVWYAGWIALDSNPPTPCSAMPRDDCIASPACVLWGSQIHDPGYVCVPAGGMCEPHVDPEVCSRTVGCVWDPGECYCPEGEDCFCAGGFAPKCRARCGSVGPCPSGEYCEFTRRQLPQCTPEPNEEGRCEWVPTTCAGVIQNDVCACGPMGMATYSSDCAARQGGAADRTGGACPP